MRELNTIESNDSSRMLGVGVDLAHSRPRSGTFVQVDQKVMQPSVTDEGLEIMDIYDALNTYDWVEPLLWTLVAKDKDEFTKLAAEAEPHGYFIRALPGAKIPNPVQACLYTRTEKHIQLVHNIIIAEEDSDLTIITGCATGASVRSAQHVGVSELFVRKNAKLTFSMIHHWAEEVKVRPRSVTQVEEGGTFINNYICMKPVRDVQMYPNVKLIGEGARCTLGSTLVGLPGSLLDIGGGVELLAPNTRADIISRTVGKGGRIIARGRMIGAAEGCKGHLECRGLMLTNTGGLLAVPELDATAQNVELSHEAAVGKIAQDQIDYLTSRGLTTDEAVQMIIRGFLSVKIEGLPAELEQEIQEVLDLSAEEGL